MLASRVGVHLRSLSCTQAARGLARAASSSSSSGGGRSSTKQALVRIPDARVSQLDNGLRVASEDWNTDACTVGVWLPGGSRAETEATNGVSQLLRQLAFGRTRSLSAADVRAQIDERGAGVDARVSRESASYTVTCLSRDLPWAVGLLAEVVRGSPTDAEQLEPPRRAALAELRAAESDPGSVVMDYLHATAYQGGRLSLSPLGQEANLRRLRPDEVRRFADARLRPRRMLVAAAGNVGHSELVDACRRHFGDMSDAGDGEAASGDDSVRFTGSSLLDRDDQLPYAHVAIAVEGPEAASVDTVALQVASAYIGSWDRSQGGGSNVASRLSRQALAAFNGGIVSYRSFFDIHSDTSLWGMHFVANQESVNYFTKDFQTDWMELMQDVREFDLVRAKNSLLTWMYLGLDGTEAACRELARHLRLYGRRVPARELEERIVGVTASGLSRAASEYIYDRCPAVAAVGPIEGLPDYNRIRGKMWFYRV